MILCLDKSRDGRPVNLQVEPDERGLRVTLQEGGDSRTNVVARDEAIRTAIRALAIGLGIDSQQLRELGEAAMLVADEWDEQLDAEVRRKAAA